MKKNKVFFIGAGPGDAELITVKGKRLIESAGLVLYAGSLVPKELVACAKPDAKVVDSSPLTLEQCHALICDTVQNGEDVARVHTGDPALFGTIREQIHLLGQKDIEYEVVPGVTTACAAAAAAGISFTVPEVTQSLVLTRMEGRTPVPASEHIGAFASIGCSMAIYLSASKVKELQEELCAKMPEHTPVLCAYRVGWPEQKLVWATAGSLEQVVAQHSLVRQTIFLVLPAELDAHKANPTTSRLYASDFKHGWRK